MNQLKCIVATTAILLSIPAQNVYGQNQSSLLDASEIDVAKVDCRELLKLNDDTDREATLSFYHGFLSGKNNTMIVDVVKLGEVSDQVIDHCIDNPNDSLLNAFEKKLSN